MGWFRNHRDNRKIERLKSARYRLMNDLYIYDEFASSLSAAESERMRLKLNKSIHRFLDLGGDPSRIDWGNHSNLLVWAREDRREYPGGKR